MNIQNWLISWNLSANIVSRTHLVSKIYYQMYIIIDSTIGYHKNVYEIKKKSL